MKTKEMIEWIDKASYRDLLSKWRFEPSESPWFAGEVGEYYSKAMSKRRSEISPSEHTEASKCIGWDKNRP